MLAKELQTSNLETILERLDQYLYQCDDTYITVCTDVFSSAFAPGVSAPQSLGLDPEIVLPLIKHVLRTRKVRGFDIDVYKRQGQKGLPWLPAMSGNYFR